MGYTNRNMFKKGNNTDRNNFKSNSLNNMLKDNRNLNQIPANERFNNFNFDAKDADQTEDQLQKLLKEREIDVPNRNQTKNIDFSLDKKEERREDFSNNFSINNSNNNIRNENKGIMEFNSTNIDYNS